MAGREPEERVLVPTMVQRWRDVSFLHWRVDAAAVAERLPDGLTPYLIDGSVWVSLLAFTVTVGPVAFPETNVRTYVSRHGKDGIWFVRIEADTIATTLGARALYGAPYIKADMSVREEGGVYRYRSPATCISVRPGAPLDDADRTELDDALTGQWRGFTKHLGRILRTHVAHQPWPLHRAEVVERLRTAADDLVTGEPELVQWSPGVTVRLSRPRLG